MSEPAILMEGSNNLPLDRLAGVNASAFPWASLARALLLAAVFPLTAQYLLKRAEV